MNLTQFLGTLKARAEFMECVTNWRTMPARAAKYAPFPDALDGRLKKALNARGVNQLYSHQAQAFETAQNGGNFVVVTPTASGKTLCYNLPVMQKIIENPGARALYLFPTKALSADQTSELYDIVTALDMDIKAFTYDGDTPASARRAIRQAGHIVVTNPDMLHSGVLPHHTKWVKLFENLAYVIIDEIHAYRGIFGSHLANVLRRLKRICAFYGAHPQFICCSATIHNPKELAETMTGQTMTLIDNNGAPSGEKHVIFYNPPVVNKQLGIRRGSVPETRFIAEQLVRNDISTIVFARSRLIVEVLTKYLRESTRNGETKIRGYRGGYLPSLRREIEHGLRSGQTRAVVSTNALELGIDIGQLEACVLCGYPGTIASTWQQAGRAGRRQGESALFFVASSAPLDQYIISHPDYFFEHSPENALINPNNLYILMSHVKCAAYELPFTKDEAFAHLESTGEMLEYLGEEGILRLVGDKWHWMAEEFPQVGVSLRSPSDQNYLIIDISAPGRPKVIGEMDRFTVPMLLHEYAIYLQEGRQFQVEKLDFEEKKAYVRAVEVDYYTDADLNTSLRVLDVFRDDENDIIKRAHGEVLVSSIVALFKKIKFDTHENLGWGPVTLPELEMHTTAAWWAFANTGKYTSEDVQSGMVGISQLIENIAPVYLMCAPRDIGVAYHVRDTFTQLPTLYIYDNAAGGIGMSDKLYEMNAELFREALHSLNACRCATGCPSCVGMLAGETGKRVARELLERLVCGHGA